MLYIVWGVAVFFAVKFVVSRMKKFEANQK